MSTEAPRLGRPHVVLVGAFDTKPEPLELLRAELTLRGCSVSRVDFGLSEGHRTAETTAAAVAELAGTTVDAARSEGRAEGLQRMAEGVRHRLSALLQSGDVDGVLWAGGSGAATVFGLTAPALPFGVPKVLVSTVTAGDTRGYLQGTDSLLFYPVVDVEGDNGVLRSVLRRAAIATAALAAAYQDDTEHSRSGEEPQSPGRTPMSGTARLAVASTMFGITTSAVAAARRLLEEQNVEVSVFHANGTGGRSMEQLVAQGRFDAVLDLTTTELADLVAGGALSAGEARLTAAANHGVPQVLAPGALDTVNFGEPDTVPERFAHRVLHRHNANVTLMRSDVAENIQLGELFAARANAAPRTTTILLPMGGFSQLDAPGMPFWWPEADAAFRSALVANLDDGVRLVETELHINDPEFAALAVEELLTRWDAR